MIKTPLCIKLSNEWRKSSITAWKKLAYSLERKVTRMKCCGNCKYDSHCGWGTNDYKCTVDGKGKRLTTNWRLK